MTFATTSVYAVKMALDKDFWRDGLTAMGETCGFEHSGMAVDQYKAYIMTSLNAGNPPEIFTWWTGNAMGEIVSSGGAAVVDELWDQKIESGEFSAGAKELFSVDGTAYAIPMLFARWVVFYNMKHFADAGVSEPKTWEDLENAAVALKAAGHTPFHASVQDGWRGFIWFSEIMIRQNPEAYKGLHTGDVAYDGPEVQAVFDQWVEWYDKGYFGDMRTPEEAQDFARGKGSMYLMGEWITGNLEQFGMTIGDDLGVFIMPNADSSLDNQVIVEGSPIFISNAGWKDPEVRKVYECWISIEGGNKWAEVLSLYNGNQKGTAPNAIIAEVTEDMAAGGHLARNRWWEAVPSDLQADIVAALSDFMLEPTAAKAKQTMSDMQSFNAAYWADQ